MSANESERTNETLIALPLRLSPRQNNNPHVLCRRQPLSPANPSGRNRSAPPPLLAANRRSAPPLLLAATLSAPSHPPRSLAEPLHAALLRANLGLRRPSIKRSEARQGRRRGGADRLQWRWRGEQRGRTRPRRRPTRGWRLPIFRSAGAAARLDADPQIQPEIAVRSPTPSRYVLPPLAADCSEPAPLPAHAGGQRLTTIPRVCKIQILRALCFAFSKHGRGVARKQQGKTCAGGSRGKEVAGGGEPRPLTNLLSGVCNARRQPPSRKSPLYVAGLKVSCQWLICFMRMGQQFISMLYYGFCKTEMSTSLCLATTPAAATLAISTGTSREAELQAIEAAYVAESAKPPPRPGQHHHPRPDSTESGPRSRHRHDSWHSHFKYEISSTISNSFLSCYPGHKRADNL